MKYQNVESYLQAKNIAYKLVSGGKELQVLCPFCKNPKHHAYLHAESGWFKCFHCGNGGGWRYFQEAIGDKSDIVDTKEVRVDENEPDIPPIKPQIVEELHQRVFDSAYKSILNYLHEKRGFTDETIKKFKIGWDGRNITYPIFNSYGECVNIKFRSDPTRPTDSKVMYGIEGRNKARLFNEKALADSQSLMIIICEGEADCILLDQMGYLVVSPTTGCGYFNSKWVNAFSKYKAIYICYDNDRNGAGQNGAGNLAKLFLEKGITVKFVNLPNLKVTEDKVDVTDYFIKLGYSRNDFQKLIDNSQSYNPDKNYKGTETTQGIKKQQLLSKPITYQQVEEKVTQFLPNTQTALKLVIAVAASSVFPNPLMLWLLLVGVPSSGKTDLVRLIKDSDVSYYLDNLTQNAFISGERSTKSYKTYDLLPLINRKCLIIKDWTSIFSLDEKMTKKLLGDLVNIYDKEFTKFSSRRGNIGYESAFSQLGCITPSTLNRHTNYMNMIGPRFLCYTMPSISPDDANKSYDIIFSNKDRSVIEKEARLYVSSYLNQLIQKQYTIKPLSKEVQMYLRSAAELMSNCRGIVILQSASFKNEEGEEVKYYETSDVQIEEPWRAVQQIIKLANYLALVVGKDEVEIEELSIIKEVVISSMPADRSQALRLIKEKGGEITAKELSDVSDRSARTSRRLLDELAALKVLEKVKGTGSIANDYKIQERFKDIFLLDPAEFVSTYSSGTETPDGVQKLSSVAGGKTARQADQQIETAPLEQIELVDDLPFQL